MTDAGYRYDIPGFGAKRPSTTQQEESNAPFVDFLRKQGYYIAAPKDEATLLNKAAAYDMLKADFDKKDAIIKGLVGQLAGEAPVVPAGCRVFKTREGSWVYNGPSRSVPLLKAYVWAVENDEEPPHEDAKDGKRW